MKGLLQLAWVFLTACVLITMVAVGDAAVEALALKYLGFRPIHWTATAFKAVWFFVLIPAYLVGVGIATWLLLRERLPDRSARHLERPDSALRLIVVGAPVVAVVGWLFFALVAPFLREGTQRESWPAAIQLGSFGVCAIETREGALNGERAFGRLAFEVSNRSSHRVLEATFTVSGGPGYQYTVQAIAPGETSRVELETDLGPLLCGGRNTSATRCRFRLFWDRVRFEGEPDVAVRAAPPETLTSIRDCPRFDVRGMWKGTDGSTLKLTQAVTRTTGELTGGPFTSFSAVVGEAKDGMVTGTVLSRAGPFLSEGTFSLRSVEGGRLQGTWAFTKGKRAGEAGAWTLTRIVEEPSR